MFCGFTTGVTGLYLEPSGNPAVSWTQLKTTSAPAYDWLALAAAKVPRLLHCSVKSFWALFDFLTAPYSGRRAGPFERGIVAEF